MWRVFWPPVCTRHALDSLALKCLPHSRGCLPVPANSNPAFVHTISVTLKRVGLTRWRTRFATYRGTNTTSHPHSQHPHTLSTTCDPVSRVGCFTYSCLSKNRTFILFSTSRFSATRSSLLPYLTARLFDALMLMSLFTTYQNQRSRLKTHV